MSLIEKTAGERFPDFSDFCSFNVFTKSCVESRQFHWWNTAILIFLRGWEFILSISRSCILFKLGLSSLHLFVYRIYTACIISLSKFTQMAQKYLQKQVAAFTKQMKTAN